MTWIVTVPAHERSDEMRAQETDPRTIIRNWGALTAEVASTVTPILLLIRSAAAVDPNMAALLKDSSNHRLQRVEHHARFMSESGFLRHDVAVDQATDVMWTCNSPEFCELLVLQRGWSLSQFGQLVADFMTAALLPEAPPTRRTP